MKVNLDNAHFNMVEQQVRPSAALTPKVINALDYVARDQFVDEDLLGLAYADTELAIGFGQTMLSPILHGRMLQALNIQPDEEVLEIGTGSGYFTALLAKMAKHVTSVEIIPELSAIAAKNLARADIKNVDLVVGDAAHGWPLPERIDVIVSTAAFVTVPDDYLQNLKVGGRMLAVVGEGNTMTVQLIQRVTEWEWQTNAIFETVISPMINAEPKPEFKF
ncbi:MAG: protein-L-isoaspartate O-methyltransferase [Gammaproteobacteria bacterium]|nr:protein-L-isoaspartate O-methyltransferase [Gammaproteobacteria bacterium]